MFFCCLLVTRHAPSYCLMHELTSAVLAGGPASVCTVVPAQWRVNAKNLRRRTLGVTSCARLRDARYSRRLTNICHAQPPPSYTARSTCTDRDDHHRTEMCAQTARAGVFEGWAPVQWCSASRAQGPRRPSQSDPCPASLQPHGPELSSTSAGLLFRMTGLFSQPEEEGS